MQSSRKRAMWRLPDVNVTILWSRLTTILVVAAILAVVATIVAFTSGSPFGVQPEVVILILTIDIILLISLIILVARRAVALWIERRQGLTGSRLYSKLVVLFSLMAALPSVTVMIFSTALFNFGIERWFTARINSALSESLAVAQTYRQEHTNKIRDDARAMADDIDNNAPLLVNNPAALSEYINRQADVRSLSEAILFDSRRNILARTDFSFMLEFEPISQSLLTQARQEGVAVINNQAGDKVRALVRLNRFVDAFLYVGRSVDARVLNHTQQTHDAVRAYQQAEKNRHRLQIIVSIVYVVITLLLLLVSLWFGLLLAHRLVRPIAQLVGAAEKVRSGDFAARVPVTQARDELSILARAFNRMTAQLEGQHTKLIQANRQLDVRRRFTEAVLEGVSAGVIGLDSQQNIQFPNRRAAALLHTSIAAMLGQPIRTIWPEISKHLDNLAQKEIGDYETQIVMEREGVKKSLLLRLKVENLDDTIVGYVITFDDLTELIAAQKTAAWADVARRLAHEIKNPLTPIQLSAERLARRYGQHIQDDKETFLACTDTIIRQVNDIGRMVDEFSNFARMPRSIRKPEDLVGLCRDVLLLFRNAHQSIQFTLATKTERIIVDIDAGLMRQALTNLIKNAVEAIMDAGARASPAEVAITIQEEASSVSLIITDTGRGFDGLDTAKLIEPYVTTREKGTGLGLAIVKKIIDEHQGTLSIQPNDPLGAKIIVKLRKKPLDLSVTNE